MELLKKLTQTFGPSGRECRVHDILIDELEGFVDEWNTDVLGNLIGHKKGDGKRILFAAHMDEIGVVVTFIDKHGFIRFSSIGGLYTKELIGRKVRFENGSVGVIGAEADEFTKKPSLSKLYIDIGCSTEDDTKKYVSIGDMGVFVGNFYESNDAIISKALDNRSGCFVLAEAIKHIKNTTNDLYFVFTSQEEVGIRGAKTAAFTVDADIAINVDVTDTGDTPSAPVMAVKLGAGAAIKVMDSSIICDSVVRNTMIEIAKTNSIPYQLEVMNDGGTDAGAIHITRSGVRCGGVSIPTRYMHSPSEMVSKNDLKSCQDLLIKLGEYNWN